MQGRLDRRVVSTIRVSSSPSMVQLMLSVRPPERSEKQMSGDVVALNAFSATTVGRRLQPSAHELVSWWCELRTWSVSVQRGCDLVEQLSHRHVRARRVETILDDLRESTDATTGRLHVWRCRGDQPTVGLAVANMVAFLCLARVRIAACLPVEVWHMILFRCFARDARAAAGTTAVRAATSIVTRFGYDAHGRLRVETAPLPPLPPHGARRALLALPGCICDDASFERAVQARSEWDLPTHCAWATLGWLPPGVPRSLARLRSLKTAAECVAADSPGDAL